MASSVELFESGVGDVSANRDGFGATRFFKVTIDAVGENADDILRDPTKITGETLETRAVPFNEVHPRRSGLYSAFYVDEGRINNLTHWVRVIYAPPVDFSTQANPWEYSWSPGLGSRMITEDVNGDPIGSSVYRIAPDGQSGGYSATINTTNDAGDPTTKVVVLQQRTGGPSFLKELQRNIPAGTFTLSRTMTGLDVDTMSALSTLSTVVNSRAFWGYPEDTVQFVGPVAQAGIGTDPNTNSEGFIWRVTLVFEYNYDGYKNTFQETFNTPSGPVGVYDARGNPIMHEVPLYRTGDLGAYARIIDQLSGSSQSTQIGINPTPLQPVRIGG